jgi:hypothetical protein
VEGEFVSESNLPALKQEVLPPAKPSIFANEQNFALAQRMAQAFAASDLVPANYRCNTANSLIAMEIAGRIGASALMVAQNLHVIEGRPSWSSSFVIAAINSCGRFKPLKFKITDLGMREVEVVRWEGPKGSREKRVAKIKIHDREFVAWTHDRDGELLEGPPVTIGMAHKEGWWDKPGSKWPTMTELMGRYRSAKFFGNLYAPDVLMGMQTDDEVREAIDITPAPRADDQTPGKNPTPSGESTASLNEKIRSRKNSKAGASDTTSQSTEQPEHQQGPSAEGTPQGEDTAGGANSGSEGHF